MSIHGLSFFPNLPDKFVTWGQEICLYEVQSRESNKFHTNNALYGTVETQTKYSSKGERRTGRTFLNLVPQFLTAESRYQYVRCVQPSYHKDRPIVAVGLGDGKIGISDFHYTDTSLEFTPRQQRPTTSLAWNELDPNILAIGHERHRSDTCVTIWNIQSGLPTDTDSFFGNAESIQSMCWDKHHRTLIAGISQKQIRLIDLRQSATSCQAVTTKWVYGLSVATNGYYLCSFFDSIITLWDLRAFERPLKQIQSAKNHTQLAWCPTRTSLLSSLQRDSPYISLYDIRGIDSEHSREVHHVKKQLMPFHNKYHTTNKGNALTSLSWHSNDFERVLLLSEAGSILDFKLPLPALVPASNRKKLPLILQRPISSSFSPTTATTTVGTTQSGSFDFSSSTAATGNLPIEILERELLEHDPVDETRQRALNDYGLKNDFERFGDFGLNPYLKNVWKTLRNLYCDERLIGLKELLGIGQSQTSEALMATSRIESHILQWPDFINNSNHLICYHSEQREKALKLCGWSNEQDLDRFIGTLRENKEFSRAAMIYVFHLKILAACDILSQAADASRDPSMFRIAAIALSSFNADRCSSTWRNQRSNANMQIQDAHLRAIFSFLTTENEQFDAVLAEEGISLADRMSFACKYLSESKLAEYVKQQIQRCTEKGDLNGLLMTGASSDALNILQAYIDATSDVQTVALLAINYFNKEYLNDSRIQFWISSYLQILNSWGLWMKRAELEIKIEKLRGTRSNRTVFLSCNFCGKSISTALHDDMRLRSASSNVNKLSSCPSCRKPLPRCSLCLLHMGTTLNTKPSSEGGQQSLGWISKPFSRWFSWCQTCRHGGHTEHLLQWFKQNSECPVSSCTCRCFDTDATIPSNIGDVS